MKEEFNCTRYNSHHHKNDKCSLIKELEEKLALTESWVKHHQNSVAIAMKDRRELEEKLAVAEAKITRLTNRGIEDMKFEIAEQREKLLIATDALQKIKHENLDDKTPTRHLYALQKWRDKVCKISWDALEKIKR